MNNERILRVTSIFLHFGGYQLHAFDAKTRRYQLTLLGLINFIVLTIFYVICVNQHFVQSAVLKVLRDVSPFLSQLTHLQLLLGLKIYIYGLYERCRAKGAADGLAQLMPRVFAHRFSRDEAYAYILLFSTSLIGLGFALYIAYELEFKLPPWDDIFVSMALFIPHYMIGGALRYYNIGCWLLREQLQRLCAEVNELLLLEVHPSPIVPNQQNTAIEMVDTANDLCVQLPNSIAVEKSVQQVSESLNELAKQQQLFNAALGKQLALLFLLNFNSLLAGVYTRLYFESTWHVLFSPTWTRIHYAANAAIYVLIGWDYLCLCLSVFLYDRVKMSFYESVCLTLQRGSQFGKEVRHNLKAMRRTLCDNVKMKPCNIFAIDLWHVLALHIVIGTIIALIVLYHHFSDQMTAMSERLDSASDDDD